MPPLASVLADLAIPPTGLLLLALLALLALRGRAGRRLGLLCVVLLLVLSMGGVSRPLLAALDPPADPAPGPPPAAIVILSGDTELTGPGGEARVGPLTLQREQAGAALARRTGLPVLVTGGVVNAPPPVAELMAQSLAEDFGVTPAWVEARSRTTWENAAFSAPLLKAAGIERVYLVTHPWHMRRSLLAFRRAGLDPVAAPLPSDQLAHPFSARDWMPRANSLLRSYFAIHEWVGLAAYALRG